MARTTTKYTTLLSLLILTSTSCVESDKMDGNMSHDFLGCLDDPTYPDSPFFTTPSAMVEQLRVAGLGNYEEAESCSQLRAQARILEEGTSDAQDIEPPALGNDSNGSGEYIFDGEIADRYELPVVKIGFTTKMGGFNMFWCTGSIISEQHILTAAHCAYRSGIQRVKVYSWDTSDNHTFNDARVKIHPSYNGVHQDTQTTSHSSYSSDIALVSFRRANRPSLMEDPKNRFRFQAKFGRQTPKQKLTRQRGTKLVIRGVGARDDIPTLPSVDGVPDMPKEDLPITVNRATTGYLRATAKEQVRACRGDSGGPALFDKGTRPVIWGAYSGFELAIGQNPKKTYCPKPGRQMYWAKTSNVHSWIENQMKVSGDYGFGPDFACKEYDNPAGSYYRCW